MSDRPFEGREVGPDLGEESGPASDLSNRRVPPTAAASRSRITKGTTMTDPFNDPASGSGVKITEFDGRLLLITPTGYDEDIDTVHGKKDAVRANVVVIDEKSPGESERHDDVLIFQGNLIGATKRYVGKGMVVGRLGTGEAKPGKNAPWILTTATDDEKTLAKAYLASTAPEL
jgi:hypothetical protein